MHGPSWNKAFGDLKIGQISVSEFINGRYVEA